MIRLRGRNGDPKQRVQQVINDLLADIHSPRVLEAGCGSMSRICPAPAWILVGIDISERQLARNNSLSEKILGDLQQHRWTTPEFDLIACWDVIEHLEDPVAAFRNLVDGLKPGGAIVLAFPNLWSLKGLVTKFTPFSVHAKFYQYVLGDRRRAEDLDQFPTPFRFAISPSHLRALAAKLTLEVVFDEIYEGPVQCHMRRTSKLANFALGALGLISRLFSFGRLDMGLSDCILIVRRPLRSYASLEDLPTSMSSALRHHPSGSANILSNVGGLDSARWFKRRVSANIILPERQLDARAQA